MLRRSCALGLLVALACATPAADGEPEDGAARPGDVFPDLTRSLEEQMEARRREAIEAARTPQHERPELDAPVVEDGLSVSELPPCFEETPDAADLAPRIAHTRLARSDFRATEPLPPEQGFEVPIERAGAFVVLRLECVASSEVRTLAPNRFRAAIGRIHFFASFDRERSWWNDALTRDPATTMRHEQLHFDIAQLYARELSIQAAEVRRRLARTGATPDLALQRFQLAFQAFLRRANEDLVRLEQAYDRDTAHGNAPERQEDWAARAKQGLLALQGALAIAGGEPLRTVGELAGRPESLAGDRSATPDGPR